MNKKTKMWILIVLGSLVGLVALVFLVGSFLPESYRANGHLDVAMTPNELWTRLMDFEKHPMAAAMAKGTEKLPDENGLPVWIEDMGHTKARVRTVVMEAPHRLVRELVDTVVPMTARVEVSIEATEGSPRPGV